MLSFSSPVLTCRPALPRDTADVLEFTKFIWNGHDYIKYVWEEWLAGPLGLLVAAEYSGHCVGIAKVTFVSPGQWWYEGLRVDPKFQGLKIGSHLHEYIDGWWLEHGDGFARLMTSAKRVKVHHLCERLGYSKIAEVKGYYVPAKLNGPFDSFHPVAADEVKTALEFVLNSQTLNLTGLMDTGWQQVTPNEHILNEIVNAGHAFWWGEHKGLLLTRNDDNDEGAKVLGVVLSACEVEFLSDFLLDIRYLAAAQGCKDVFWIAPIHDVVLSALKNAGFKTDWEDAAFVYEKRHP
jgi:GNAT superfamily N-acetyltransferase